MDSMIRHHTIAIRRASVCLDRAKHPALLSFCENITETQLDEFRLMEHWLCEWYDRCRPNTSAA